MNHEIHDFDTDVVERSHHTPVLADFWAEWCGPCRMLGPVLEKLAATAGGRWVLAKVDVDDPKHRAAAQSYRVQSIPAVKLFVDGAVVAEFTGALPESQVARWLEANLPSTENARLGEAIALLQAGEIERAKTALEALLGDETLDEQARVLLARVTVFDAPDRARDLVAGIGPGSDYAQTACAVNGMGAILERDPGDLPTGPGRESYAAALAALRAQAFEAAIERFIAVLARDKHYDGDGARKGCLAVFAYLGHEHPISKGYRRAFQSALN